MNIVFVIHEIVVITNPVVGESALPDFSLSTKDDSEGVRVSAFDQLNGVFERYVMGRSQQKMDMLGHEDEGVKLITTLAAISIQGL